MSHVATIDLHITDLDCLKAACAELGLEFREGQQTYKWYGQKPKPCVHALAVSNAKYAYEIGIVDRADGKPGYEMQWDSWDNTLRRVVGPHANKLKQEYAAQVAMKQCRKQGWAFVRERAEDGTVRIKARR